MKCDCCKEKINFNKYWSFCFDCRTTTCQTCLDQFIKDDPEEELDKIFYSDQACYGCGEFYFINREEDLGRIKRNIKIVDSENKHILHFFYAVFKSNGFGCDIDHNSAFLHFFQSARKNFTPAINCMAKAYSSGNGIAEDYDHALRYYIRGSMMGCSESIYCLGISFLKGIGVEKNIAEGNVYIEISAKRGYIPAYCHLSQIYRNKMDFEEGDYWFQKFIEEDKNERPIPGMSDLFRKERTVQY